MEKIIMIQQPNGDVLVSPTDLTVVNSVIKLPFKDFNGEKWGLIYKKALDATVSKIVDKLKVIVSLELSN